MRTLILLALLLLPLGADAQMLQLIVNAQQAVSGGGGFVCSRITVDVNSINVDLATIGVSLCP